MLKSKTLLLSAVQRERTLAKVMSTLTLHKQTEKVPMDKHAIMFTWQDEYSKGQYRYKRTKLYKRYRFFSRMGDTVVLAPG